MEDGTNAGIVIYSFDSMEFNRLMEFGRNPVWLADNRRLLFYDNTFERPLYLSDSTTKKVKELATNIGQPDISPDNRHIYAYVRDEEADIWLLELDEEHR